MVDYLYFKVSFQCNSEEVEPKETDISWCRLENIVMTREEKAELVKKMRKITMAGTMDCKRCLERMDYDLDKAILYLKTKYGRYVTRN